jgi:hypothetical protein
LVGNSPCDAFRDAPTSKPPMTVREEDRALASPEYWDGRYAENDGHEWFRTFADLRPFFERNLFAANGFLPQDDPYIVHFGSGDSVCDYDLLFCYRDICQNTLNGPHAHVADT